MVSCLTLLHDSHILSRRVGGMRVTACGLAIADEHAREGLIAGDPGAVSCRSCREAGEAGASEAPRQPRAFADWLMARVVNGNRPDALVGAMSADLAARFRPMRIARLHELFPDWHGTVADVIADGDRVMLRYHASCEDRSGLLGDAGACERRDQLVILRLQSGRLVEIVPIRDEFGLWTVAAPAP